MEKQNKTVCPHCGKEIKKDTTIITKAGDEKITEVNNGSLSDYDRGYKHGYVKGKEAGWDDCYKSILNG